MTSTDSSKYAQRDLTVSTSTLVRESERLVMWMVMCCGLFSLHVYQLVLMGQSWKGDLTGWAFLDSGLDGGWLLLSLFALGGSGLAMVIGLAERPKALWAVVGLSAARLVLVALSATAVNDRGLDTRFGVSLTIVTLVVTMLAATNAAWLD